MFTPQEKRVIYGITFAVAVRMLGLFLLLPVLSPYVKNLPGSSPILTGFAVGIYGLVQALLQIPFGYLSDKLGRKPVITMGFLFYIVGSILGGIAGNIYHMIVARAVQGAGAISSSAVALSADLIREEVRTRAFAFIGSSIGIVFAVSIIIAPPLAGKFGVPFIFFLTAFLSLLSLLYILIFIPEPSRRKNENLSILKASSEILKNRYILFINFSVSLLHCFMVLLFTLIPIFFIEIHNFPKVQHWKVYLPVFLISMAVMVPAIIFAEKRKKLKEVIIAGIIFILFGIILSYFYTGFYTLIASLLLFFIGFHFLEPTLPSLLTRIAGEDKRGLAVGFYNTFQFGGAFAGGILGGLALKYGYVYVLILSLFLLISWLLLAFRHTPSASELKR